ncbi:MAG: hypothetical protein IPK85_25870 [Gemmatimonadetes bacterium]|nr:hypothetical protein [Gemmatimonadota bacterium]
MIFTLALGGLAISSIYMGASTQMLSKLYDRERDYRYAAEWALAVGESRITVDTTFTLPDSLYVQLMNGQTVTDALGQAVPKVKVDLYAGVGGQSSGQYGRFVELVAVAYDNGGARHVRRLELQAENFARYAMFVDSWATSACYATGEILRGRAHSNQDWKNCSSAPGVIHTDTVSAVGNVTGTGQYQSAKLNGVPRINFPSVAKLSFMPGYASSANLSFLPGTRWAGRWQLAHGVRRRWTWMAIAPSPARPRAISACSTRPRHHATHRSGPGTRQQVAPVLGGAQRPQRTQSLPGGYLPGWCEQRIQERPAESVRCLLPDGRTTPRWRAASDRPRHPRCPVQVDRGHARDRGGSARGRAVCVAGGGGTRSGAGRRPPSPRSAQTLASPATSSAIRPVIRA